jgi:hypothetical protein
VIDPAPRTPDEVDDLLDDHEDDALPLDSIHEVHARIWASVVAQYATVG